MSYYCIDHECQNMEAIEDKMNCPVCGAKSELVNYMDIQHLIDAKRKARKLKETILFTLSTDAAGLSDKLELLLLELGKLEADTVHLLDMSRVFSIGDLILSLSQYP
jgi:hypothetical protein